MSSELYRSLSHNNGYERMATTELDIGLPMYDRPSISKAWMLAQLQDEGLSNMNTEESELIKKVEEILLERVQSGDNHALFVLGQFYFEQGRFDKAELYFLTSTSRGSDWQAMFQLGVIYYDGLGRQSDPKKGFEYMYKVATSNSPEAKHLLRLAQYNIGLAYHQGFGVKSSPEEAQKFWLLAADDGNPNASVKAQSMLGLFYSQNEEYLDVKKAFYWHTEACGNGSLESQGALGVMYMNGVGTKQDTKGAFICFTDAARRGNIYATGHLVAYYYQHKLFTKALSLSAKVSQLKIEALDEIAQETNCLVLFIRKGIAMACFYYARCLTLGRGIIEDKEEAKIYYSRSFTFDVEICNELMKRVERGEI